MIDAISILCASELEIPGVYGVNAIGGDAEMPMAHIVRNIGMAMQKGAFIGGNGLTQEDINTYGEILKWIPGEEVENGHMRRHRDISEPSTANVFGLLK